MKELISIQSELNAPKSQVNKFGNYKYRSCEDILAALKPLLTKYKCFLNISDEIVFIEGRFYVKATTTLSNGEDEVSASAYAREEEQKKGMDGAQVTGSASSYSRKYSLNGLFAIDDTKDSDATNDHSDKPKPKAAPTPAKTVNGSDLNGLKRRFKFKLAQMTNSYQDKVRLKQIYQELGTDYSSIESCDSKDVLGDLIMKLESGI